MAYFEYWKIDAFVGVGMREDVVLVVTNLDGFVFEFNRKTEKYIYLKLVYEISLM